MDSSKLNILKRELILIGCLLFSVSNNLWGQTFSMRSDFPYPEAANGAIDVEEFGGYIVISQAGLTNDGQHYGLTFFDTEGVEQFSLDQYEPDQIQIYGRGGSNSISSDGEELAFVYSQYSNDGQDIGRVLIFKTINTDLDITKTYTSGPDTLETIWRHVIHLNDGGYLITGWTDDTDNGTDGVSLTKLDENAELVWNKILPGEFDPWGSEESLKGNNSIELSDGSFLVSALKFYHNEFAVCTPLSYKANPLIIKLTSEGEEIWRDEWDDCYANWPHILVHTSDDKVIIGASLPNTELSTNTLNWTDICLIGYSEEGDVLWENTYGASSVTSEISKIIETSDGELLVTGNVWCPSFGGRSGFVLKTTALGDSIWMREHRFVEDAESRLYDITEASDGYLYASGQTNSSEGYPSLDSWLVKMDEDGCIIENCDVSISERHQEDEFAIYPNPANDFFKANWPHSVGITQIQIKDIAGKTLDSFVVSASRNSFQVNSKDLIEGIYLISISNNKGVTIVRRLSIIHN